MGFPRLFNRDAGRHALLASGQVVPDPARCVQCGICSYNCPVDINVRAHAWSGEPIVHDQCITCGECVTRCPRGALQFEKTDLFTKRKP